MIADYRMASILSFDYRNDVRATAIHHSACYIKLCKHTGCKSLAISCLEALDTATNQTKIIDRY